MVMPQRQLTLEIIDEKQFWPEKQTSTFYSYTNFQNFIGNWNFFFLITFLAEGMAAAIDNDGFESFMNKIPVI